MDVKLNIAHRLTAFIIIFAIFLSHIHADRSTLFINATFGKTPTYCVDSNVLDIFKERYMHCMKEGSAIKEFEYLRQHSAADFQRAHELLAHKYFVEDDNPHRVKDCTSADMEYIPLLPLSWRTGVPTNTLCTSNGFCPPRFKNADPICSYKRLVEDIVKFVEYVRVYRKQDISAGPHKFSVASTFNMRTSIGFGLPSSQRSGPTYNAVTSYVINSYVGHYERHPQCPDVLRKWWKHVAEIPYNPIQTIVSGAHTVVPHLSQVSLQRGTTFFFSGKLVLWGPERVCSVRCAVAKLADRTDTLVVNVTDEHSYSPVSEQLIAYLKSSIFCLVTKSDSYSTAFFYDAIQAGCIPIVVSNWFIFSFPWFISYHEFVIRIEEDDFLKDPHGCLDAILADMTKDKIHSFQRQMTHWAKYLTFEYHNISFDASGSSLESIVPFELMLREFRTVQTTEICAKCIYTFCHRSWLCDPPVVALQIANKLTETRSHLCQHVSRLIGYYKIVYFMSCVRIMWPLKLGDFRPVDLKPDGLPPRDKDFVLKFHNASGARPNDWYFETHPPLDEKVRSKIKNYHIL